MSQLVAGQDHNRAEVSVEPLPPKSKSDDAWVHPKYVGLDIPAVAIVEEVTQAREFDRRVVRVRHVRTLPGGMRLSADVGT